MWVAALAWLAVAAQLPSMSGSVNNVALDPYTIMTNHRFPFRIPYAEARHFEAVLGMSFFDYDMYVCRVGASTVEERLLASLTARQADCPGRSPAEFMTLWREVLVERLRPPPAVVQMARRDVGPFAKAVSAGRDPAARPVAKAVAVSSLPSPDPAVSGLNPPPNAEPFSDDGELVDPNSAVSQSGGAAASAAPAPSVLEETPKVSLPLQSVAQSVPATELAAKPAVSRGSAVPKRSAPVGEHAMEAIAETAGRSKQAKVLALAADSRECEGAVATLRDQLYAETTWGSHMSQVALYKDMCAVKGFRPFPLTVTAVEMFVALLAAAGYAAASIPIYLQAIYRQMILMNMVIAPELQQWKSLWSRAVKRDMGDSHRMLPITFEHLKAMREFVKGLFPKFLFNMAVFTWFFLLRIDESLGSKEWRGICRNQIFLNHGSRQVTVTLGAYKTNMEGAKCSRTHSCVCTDFANKKGLDVDYPLCPFCAAEILCSMNVAEEHEPLRPEHDSRAGHKKGPGKAPTSENMLHYLREWLTAVAAKYPLLGIKMKSPADRELFGTHSLRRGAAQALIYAGWTLDDVKFFGRWLSSAIELYLLQVPMKTFGRALSGSMAGIKSLRGVNPVPESGDVPDAPMGAPVSRERAVLAVGDFIEVELHDQITIPLFSDPVGLGMPDDLMTLEKVPGTSDKFIGQVFAMLPHVPPDFNDALGLRTRELVFHDSIRKAHPQSWQDLNQDPQDHCVILDFSHGVSVTAALLVVSLNVLPYRISRGVLHDTDTSSLPFPPSSA